MFYIDIGSSTIKTYRYEDSKLELTYEKSIFFKEGFNKDIGIENSKLNELIDYFNYLTSKYEMNMCNTRLFATGIFRKISSCQKEYLIKNFNNKFNLFFNIISHGIESYYVSKSMEINFNENKVLILNMGGKTSELIFIDNNKIIERVNLDIGVADVLNDFPKINENTSVDKVDDIVKHIKKKIILTSSFQCDFAVFTGGELRFEKLVGYNLKNNDLFSDYIHDKKISIKDFKLGNKHIFDDLTIKDLYRLMPHNPKWMDGARAGVLLAEAIFDVINVNMIVPSDLNLINGVINDLK
jgi:exopolyphosphatase/pppGpp-phosphohydrolase